MLPSGDLFFTMKKEELKVKMEKLGDTRGLREWSTFGTVT